ncbi:MAG: YhgE/Pip family protein, partial [Eubacterium sp.]|nr:YhgE/Pip family protein [Eubacterium sp.]
VEEFFGRYLVFFFIGQIQTLITVVGALLFVGIQCEHPLLLLVAMSFTSFTFTILNYALTFAFGAVGEAVIVVVMVLQVAGSGGTFPVDVLPDFYNMLYKYMPFVYSTNAAKEAIAGTYGSFYADNLMVLFIYVGVALIIGLLLSVPCKKLISYIKESTEKTDLIV